MITIKKVKYLKDFLYLDPPRNELRTIETVGTKKHIKAKDKPSPISKSI
jgi:hypothetical protein